MSGVPGDAEEEGGAAAGSGEGEARAGPAGPAEKEGRGAAERCRLHGGQTEAAGEELQISDG